MRHQLRYLLVGFVALLLTMTAACGSSGHSTGTSGTSGSAAPSGSTAPQDSRNESEPETSNIDYPKQPVKFIITHAAGGSTDNAMRVLAPYLEKALGQPVVIENMVGAGGNVAAAHVYRQKPDGYTFLVSQFPSLMISQLALSGDFDTREMTPIYQVMGGQAQSLLVKGDSPWKTFEDVVKASKSRRLTTAGPGLASNGFLGYALFGSAGVESDYVPFDSGPESISAVAGGQVDLAVADTVSLPDLIAAGQVRAVAVASPERNHNAPDAPTLRELGFDGAYEITISVIGPPNIPDEIVDILADAFEEATSDPDFIEKAKQARYTPIPLGPAEFKKSIEEGFKLVEQYKDLLMTP